MIFRSSSVALVIEGTFLAVSTGVGGDLCRVSALINRTVPRDWHDPQPLAYIRKVAREEGISGKYFCLLTAVPMDSLVICRSGLLTVFVTAGISSGTINIIGVCHEGMTRNALLESIATISSAKTEALLRSGRNIVATPTDAVIMACEGPHVHRYAGSATPVGKDLIRCVEIGVPGALERYEGGARSPLELRI